MTKDNDFAATIADSFDRDLHADLKADYVLANPPLVARDRCNSRFRDRRGEMLFIDAREPGTMMDRSQRELTDEDIAQGANPYHAWRGDQDCQQAYEDMPGACKQDDRTSIPGGDCCSRYVDSGLVFGRVPRCPDATNLWPRSMTLRCYAMRGRGETSFQAGQNSACPATSSGSRGSVPTTMDGGRIGWAMPDRGTDTSHDAILPSGT